MKKLALILTVLMALSGCAPGERSSQLSSGKGPVRKHVKVKKRSARAKLKVKKLIVNSDKDIRPIVAKIKPRDAGVELIATAQDSDIIKVNIKITNRGTGGGNPVIVFLAKPGYIGQQYFIYEPIKEVTATLLRFSTTRNEIKESFRRAARIYKLPMAYPGYLPPELKLTKAIYDDNVYEGNIPSGLSTGFLLLEWSSGSRSLMMQFLPQRMPQVGRPPKYARVVKVDNNLEAKLEVGLEDADFFTNGRKTSWYASGQGLGRREFIKIIKSIGLSE